MPSAGFAQPVMERSPLLPGAHRRSSRRTSRTHLLLVLGVALAFAAAVYAQWMPLMQLVRWLNPSVMWFVDLPPGVRAAALTIDDSPRGDGSSTEAILDMLREAGVRATFFVISASKLTPKEALQHLSPLGRAQDPLEVRCKMAEQGCNFKGSFNFQ